MKTKDGCDGEKQGAPPAVLMVAGVRILCGAVSIWNNTGLVACYLFIKGYAVLSSPN